MLAYIDSVLNKITMYRLVLYYLIALVALTLLFSLFGILGFSTIHTLFSLVVILGVCWGVNTLCARVLGAATNIESVYITGFILFLLISPVAPTDAAGIGFLAFASVAAMASKYVLAFRKKHVFNPAAFGVALAGFLGIGWPTWWVGTLPLLPFVFIGGVLIVRKTRRFDLVGTFLVVTLFFIFANTGIQDPLTTLTKTFLQTPLFFLAFVMLTEPITMPPTRRLRTAYAALVAFFYASNVHMGPLYFSPELALLAGNLFAFAVSTKGRYTMRLVEKRTPAPSIDEFVFVPDRPVHFQAGQYLEWTLPHTPSDTRGNRRYFTIASSPTEERIHLGIKFYEPTSSFKIALGKLKINDTITASQLDGDFILPRNPQKKIAFIAGGIGVTPFRSHLQYLVDKNEKRDVVLFYASRPEDIVYRDIFERAERIIGLKAHYVTKVDESLIRQEIPDFKERTFYLSGPPGMVDAYKKILTTMGVSRFRIKTDYFPGLA